MTDQALERGMRFLDAQQPRQRPGPPLVVVSLEEFLARPLPPREEVLGPWLLTQSLNMIHSWRGVGKTHAALGIAVASGGKFLGWKARRYSLRRGCCASSPPTCRARPCPTSPARPARR